MPFNRIGREPNNNLWLEESGPLSPFLMIRVVKQDKNADCSVRGYPYIYEIFVPKSKKVKASGYAYNFQKAKEKAELVRHKLLVSGAAGVKTSAKLIEKLDDITAD